MEADPNSISSAVVGQPERGSKSSSGQEKRNGSSSAVQPEKKKKKSCLVDRYLDNLRREVTSTEYSVRLP